MVHIGLDPGNSERVCATAVSGALAVVLPRMSNMINTALAGGKGEWAYGASRNGHPPRSRTAAHQGVNCFLGSISVSPADRGRKND